MASKPNDEMNVLEEDKSSSGKFKLPKDHQPGMVVPRGGSMCKNCEYLKDAKKGLCGEPNFIAWDGSKANPPKPAGSDKIPAPIDCYCSDWFEAAKGTDNGKGE